jgi:hypothetical protein
LSPVVELVQDRFCYDLLINLVFVAIRLDKVTEGIVKRHVKDALQQIRKEEQRE